MLIPLLLNN